MYVNIPTGNLVYNFDSCLTVKYEARLEIKLYKSYIVTDIKHLL